MKEVWLFWKLAHIRNCFQKILYIKTDVKSGVKKIIRDDIEILPHIMSMQDRDACIVREAYQLKTKEKIIALFLQLQL